MKSDEDKDVNDDSEKPTELTSKLLNEIIENFQYACDFVKENDPDEVRSSKMIQMKFVAQKSFKVCLVTSKVTLKRLKKS